MMKLARVTNFVRGPKLKDTMIKSCNKKKREFIS